MILFDRAKEHAVVAYVRTDGRLPRRAAPRIAIAAAQRSDRAE